MKNYCSYMISSKFEVEDLEKFQEEVENVNGDGYFNYDNNKVYISTEEDLSSFYELSNNEDEGYYAYFDYFKLIQTHLKKDSLVVLTSFSYEKERSVTSKAYIITKNNIKTIDFLENIVGDVLRYLTGNDDYYNIYDEKFTFLKGEIF